MPPPTNPDVRDQIHDLDKRLAVLEVQGEARHEAIMSRLDKFSDHGRQPLDKPRLFGFTPGSGKEVAIILVAVGTVLTGGGGITWLASSSGGASGAKDAVEQGQPEVQEAARQGAEEGVEEAIDNPPMEP